MATEVPVTLQGINVATIDAATLKRELYEPGVEKDLQKYRIGVDLDLEHAEEGRKLIRAYADTPERRQRFYTICEFVRDRLWEAWDAVFQAADLDLPQAVYPKKKRSKAGRQRKAA